LRPGWHRHDESSQSFVAQVPPKECEVKILGFACSLIHFGHELAFPLVLYLEKDEKKILFMLVLCTDWVICFDANLIAGVGRYASKCIRTEAVHSTKQAGEVLGGEKVLLACLVSISCCAGVTWLT
jgi:hypothetical protein